MRKLAFYLVLGVLTACEGPEGPQGPAGINGTNGKNSLINLSDEPVGGNCSAGGVRIDSGLDANENNVLDISEVQQTKYACNGISDGPGELRIWTTGGLGSWSGTTEGNGNHLPTKTVTYPIYDNFILDNFSGYDSAYIYVDTLKLTNLAPPNNPTGVKMILELIDVTHGNIPIANSLMEFEGGGPYHSPNFFGNLPQGPVRLAISVRMSADNFYGEIRNTGAGPGVMLIIAKK